MPTPIAGQKILQVQLDASKVEKLDAISNRTYVPRATLLRMAVDMFINAAEQGQIQMGISVGGAPSAGAVGGQPTFSVREDPRQAPPPPPPAAADMK